MDVLNKTHRINVLFDFYGSLLTEKQITYMQYYFHENFSLAEIAEQYDISRQAVYEHISRAEKMLEQYEQQLQLMDKQIQRLKLIEQLEEQSKKQGDTVAEALLPWIQKLKSLS